MGGSQVALAYATNRPVFIAQNTVIADVTPEGLRPSATKVLAVSAGSRPVSIAQNTVIADVTPEGLRPSAEMSRICISKHVLSSRPSSIVSGEVAEGSHCRWLWADSQAFLRKFAQFEPCDDESVVDSTCCSRVKADHGRVEATHRSIHLNLREDRATNPHRLRRAAAFEVQVCEWVPHFEAESRASREPSISKAISVRAVKVQPLGHPKGQREILGFRGPANRPATHLQVRLAFQAAQRSTAQSARVVAVHIGDKVGLRSHSHVRLPAGHADYMLRSGRWVHASEHVKRRIDWTRNVYDPPRNLGGASFRRPHSNLLCTRGNRQTSLCREAAPFDQGFRLPSLAIPPRSRFQQRKERLMTAISVGLSLRSFLIP
jgi:hypothetical protein